MSTPQVAVGPSASNFALTLADRSYEWYRTAAISSRRRHRVSAIGIQVFAALIPVSVLLVPRFTVIPAILGAAILITSGARATFAWQENYIRFSGAREAVEAQRRLYQTAADPYGDSKTRDQILAIAVTNIERDEMSVWVRIASEPPRQ